MVRRLVRSKLSFLAPGNQFVNLANKYQPYHGYGAAHPFLWNRFVADYPHRVHTRSDWRYATEPPYHPEHQHYPKLTISACRRCGRTHCRWCGCIYQPWKRAAKDSDGSVFEKRRLHRVFRRQAKRAIQRELAGEEISHNFRVSGPWLD